MQWLVIEGEDEGIVCEKHAINARQVRLNLSDGPSLRRVVKSFQDQFGVMIVSSRRSRRDVKFFDSVLDDIRNVE